MSGPDPEEVVLEHTLKTATRHQLARSALALKETGNFISKGVSSAWVFMGETVKVIFRWDLRKQSMNEQYGKNGTIYCVGSNVGGEEKWKGKNVAQKEGDNTLGNLYYV